ESKMIKGVSTPESAPSEVNESQLPQIRGNFNETAFFFPQLRTNKQGETQIAFTVPESNTKWRFRVLAHDKDLNTGKAEAFTVSQKELMVTPNIPRFLRHGDRTSISTKISNLSEAALSGKVKLEFFDPVSEQLIENIVIENQNQEFSLDKDASSNAAWSFDVPKNIDILGFRIVAQTESFSDGEQHALTVLPNKVLVTESMRIDLNGNQSKEYTMSQLVEKTSTTAENYRLTLEFTSNAAWYAIQALPVLSNPDNDNSISWFASFYANSLGYHISEAYPQVSTMIEAWKKQGGNKETFLSNLEKNQELKNVLLEETPWVMEAKNESDQKERLSLLFDLNRSQNLTSVAIDKLQELQTVGGGWSWFKNFSPSVSITQYILYGFSQLNDLGVKGYSDKIWNMQAKGISFIDEQALGRFELLKKWNKDWKNIKTISITDLEYLYVRSAYKQYALNVDLMAMVDFYTTKIEENWTQYGLYERSLISVLMNRNKKTSLEQAILKSLREHATVNDEMGMFWANNKSRVFMSQSAVSVHAFIMHAFLKGGAKTNEMDNMKRWLLKQKQTQNWESTHATMDAIYALLSTGSDWFSTNGETSIKLGNLLVEPENKELGTGYFKEAWSRSEIKSEMGNVSINHKGNAPAWGALYLQYFEDADMVSKADGSLDVEKLLFIEKTDESGRSLVPVTENTPMKVGDKVVVRLTIRTDRDIEFVHLKDMRAAAFEPVEQISATRWQGGTIYYQASKDASTNFYFDVLPRGTYVFEYGVYVNRAGNYSNGITTVQCMYAPEFTSHTEGIRIIVKD
ncbi:MAG: alpha-2-macroglobulin family protein, partial [Dysgonamonadaceae bacterium]